MTRHSDYRLERKLSWLCERVDFSTTVYEDLVALEHDLELSLNKLRAQKARLIQEQEEDLKRMHHHIGAGIRFTVMLTSYDGEKMQIQMQYLDVDLKDALISGLPAVSCVEGVVCEDIPSVPGVCRVGGAFFMVGGRLDRTEIRYGNEYKRPYETKLLWSAPAPPIAGGGSFTMTWTRCDTAMHSSRILPMVVPLHDGRIFICGGTSEPECWVEIYDPQKGEFDRRDLPEHIFNPIMSSCFLWDHQSVMLYYDNIYKEEEEEEVVNKSSLILYNVERNNWEIFAENLPASQCGNWRKRNLIYVGGNILFIIDQASCWFVYDLYAKRVIGKVDVRVRDGIVMQALYLGNTDIKSSSWIFYIFVPNVEKDIGYYCNLRYAKVEVVQGKGGDYIATVQFSGVLKIGDFHELYIIADEASLKRAAEEERLKERERRMMIK